ILGHATINVGSINGGKQPNIVPDKCAILIDRRTLPGETNKQVITELKSYLRQNKMSARFSPTQIGVCGPIETSLRQPLVQQLFESIGQKRQVGVDYFSDAGVLTAAGIPSVLFGPGGIAKADTTDEWVSLRELARG